MIKDENYVNIQGFMITRLKLTGNDLLVYAIIYGFSQDDESAFKGTRAYLAEWCNCTVRGVQKNINNLLKRGLIEQIHHSPNNQQVHYRVTDWQATGEQSSLGSEQSSPVPSEQSSPASEQSSLGSEQSSPVPVNNVPTSSEQSSQAIDNIVDSLNDNLVDTLVDKEEEETTSCNCFINGAPTKKEVFDFISAKCPHINAEGFFNYYNKSDWTQNGEPIKDWRRLALTWEENMVKEASRIPFEEEKKLWKQYEDMFGQKVPCQYFGIRWKYVQLAIATGVALKDE